MTATSTAAGDELGPLLIRVRRQRGQSQLRVADALCAAAGVATVSRHEISRWERGERIPSQFWLGWLSEVLSIPITQLEHAAACTRDRRTGGPTGAEFAGTDGPLVSSWPWRLIRACRFVDETGQVTVRLLRPPATGLVDGAAMDG